MTVDMEATPDRRAAKAYTDEQIAEAGVGVALGETSTTAYRGDRGKAAYDHSQATGNPHGTTPTQITGATTSRLLGRTTAGTGAVEELTASQARTLLGLVVGTDVQAYSSVLASLVSNGAPGTTGLAVLLASTAAAARSTLGVNQQRTARILFSVDEPLTYTTWTSTAATVLGGGYGVGANASTESWTYEVWLDSGTYKVRSVVRKHVRGPIITFSLSGGIGTIGTHDTYNGSSLGDHPSTLTSSLSVTTPGFYTLTMTNSTRNASNITGWDMTPQVLTFTRTGS